MTSMFEAYRASHRAGTYRPAILRCLVQFAVLCGLGISIGSTTANAQQTIFVGPRSQNDVSVDLSTLDRLGPAPDTSGRSLKPGEAPGDSDLVVLHPPKKKAVAKTAKPAEKTKTAQTPSKNQTTAKKKIASAAPTPAPVAPAPVTPAPVTPPPAAPAPAVETPAAPVAAATPVATPAPAAPVPATPAAPVAPPPAPAAIATPTPPTPTPITPTPMAAAPAPTTPTPAAPPPATPASPPQVAAKPPAPAPAAVAPESKGLSVNFATTSTELTDSAKSALNKVIETMKRNANQRVELVAYASGGDDPSSSQVRRVSLVRGLTVRTYLIDQGISSTRIDVRALGNKTDGGAADRVDLVLSDK